MIRELPLRSFIRDGERLEQRGEQRSTAHGHVVAAFARVGLLIGAPVAAERSDPGARAPEDAVTSPLGNRRTAAAIRRSACGTLGDRSGQFTVAVIEHRSQVDRVATGGARPVPGALKPGHARVEPGRSRLPARRLGCPQRPRRMPLRSAPAMVSRAAHAASSTTGTRPSVPSR